jgi:hypothetical protein
MEPIAGQLAFHHEVDEARWLSVDQASRLLTYERDIALVRSAPAFGGDPEGLT